MMLKNINQKVLLIEPDRVLANIYSKALSKSGVDVHITSMAQSAISMIDRVKPKLIILELCLPTNNGIEFLYELRSYPDLQEIKVIVLSYTSEIEFRVSPRQAKILNISKYLYKPSTSVSKLVEVVVKILQI